jgi:hypothetical protein
VTLLGLASVGLPIGSPALLSQQSVSQEKELRDRVERFYSLLQENRLSQAMNFVTEETGDNFLSWPKGDFTTPKILEVKPSGPSSPSRAEVTVDVQIPGPVGTPIHLKSTTSWTLANGTWLLVAAKATSGGLQKVFTQPAPPPPPPPELKFEKDAFSFGQVDGGGTTTATFEFKNIADHSVHLDITTFCECLVVKDLKKEYQPGESGKFKVDFHAQDYSVGFSYGQSILVKTRPGPGGQALLIEGFIMPKPASAKP